MGKESRTASIQDRVDSFKATHGETVPVDAISAIVTSILNTLDGGVSSGELAIAAELQAMLDYIERTRQELSTMRPRTLSEVDIPAATDELDAIVDHTERAAQSIMDVAEELGELSDGRVGQDAGKLRDLSTRIFEASSFQDITGQRISKVVDVLQHLEQRLGALAEAVGDDVVGTKPASKANSEDDITDDRMLLHGPQLEGEGNSQDEIDALLSDFD